jgi:hypothetical protein
MPSEPDAPARSDQPTLKEWDTPSFQELSVGEAESGFVGSGTDNAIYS